MAKEVTAKKEVKKTASTTKKSPEKKLTAKETAEPEKKVTAEDINTKLKAVEASNSKKQLAENKRLYNRYIRQIDSAYKNMEKCYLDTAFALHSIYQNQLYKIDNFKNIYDFAKEKYNIARGTCNTFINICEKFGVKNENGNISQLALEYEKYSASQLAVMLTFPVALLNRCNSGMTVRELKRMKSDFQEEQAQHKALLDSRKESDSQKGADSQEEFNSPDMLPDDITGNDIPGNDAPPMNEPTKLDLGKGKKSIHVCTVKTLDELLKLKESIADTLNDIVNGNKKKNACIEVNIIF